MNKTEIIVRVKNKKQLEGVLEFSGISSLILGFGCAAVHIDELKRKYPEKRFFLQMPDVLREKRADSVKKLAERALLFDGIVICSFDELGLLNEVKEEVINRGENLPSEEEWQVIGDSFLYAYNTQAVSFYKSFYPDMKFLLSDELTDKEIQSFMDSASEQGFAPLADFIYKVYGYQPLMITNQCLNRNYTNCEQPLLRFSDEKKNQFYITSECGQCYDIVYNGQPTIMLDKTEFRDQGFLVEGQMYSKILLDFTIESADMIRRILKGFLDKERPEDYLPGKLTRGHHYKVTE